MLDRGGAGQHRRADRAERVRTTLFIMVTGYGRVDSGNVFLANRKITNLMS
ncbi:MAG TPA: hypothetical protein VF933_32225 [Streptosporangiaceae bacterium]